MSPVIPSQHLAMHPILGGHVRRAEDTFECVPCQRHFESVNCVINHCRQTTKHGWCESCQEIVVTNAEKERHLGHDEARQKRCEPCDKDFETESEKTQHHKDEHYCEPCARVFQKAVSKRQHLVSLHHHYFCYLCESTEDLGTFRTLELHLQNCHPQCPICFQYLLGQDDMEEHALKMHFPCDECGQIFRRQIHLEKHMESHGVLPTTEPPELIQCPFCPKQSTGFRSLLSHLESNAPGACFSKDQLMEIVFDTRHAYWFTTDISDDRPYVCPACKRKYSCMSMLYQHLEDKAPCTSLLESDSFVALCRHITDELASL